MPPEAADCPAQRFQGGRGINRTGKGIAHPFAGTQALDDGRIEPALSGGNAGNIAPRPDLVAQKRSFALRRLDAMGWLCRELVMTLQARHFTEAIPASRICRWTRLREQPNSG